MMMMMLVEKYFDLSDAPEMFAANIGLIFNQTFRRKVTHLLRRYSDCILPHAYRASDKVRLSLIAFQRVENKALILPLKFSDGYSKMQFYQFCEPK